MTGMTTVFNLRLSAGLARKQNLFGSLCFSLSDMYNDRLYFLSKSVLLVTFLSLICKHTRFSHLTLSVLLCWFSFFFEEKNRCWNIDVEFFSVKRNGKKSPHWLWDLMLSCTCRSRFFSSLTDSFGFSKLSELTMLVLLPVACGLF